MSPHEKNITLYCRNDRSDKVYTITIDRAPGGGTIAYQVNFSFGPRGGTMQTGCKMKEGTMDAAEIVFDRLMREKLAKGYFVGAPAGELVEAAPPQPATEQQPQITPMLLNDVEDDRQLINLLEDPQWLMQRKMDGQHWLLFKRGKDVTAQSLGRGGAPGRVITKIPKEVVDDALKIEGDFVLDGEIIGPFYHAFDIIVGRDRDVRGEPCSYRMGYLQAVLADVLGDITTLNVKGGIRLVETVGGVNDFKTRTAINWKKEGIEGLVFKHALAHYTSGRPNSGGRALKYKFVQTASVIVGKQNGDKRSVYMHLHAHNTALGPEIGKVTIPPNQPMPKQGDVIEVRYLYSDPQSKKLIQAVCLGIRDYILPADCTEQKNRIRYKGKDRE